MRLTARMRDALEQARHAPLRRVLKPGPGAPPWPAHPGTLHALERRELLARGELRNRDGIKVMTWTITDTGRQALEPVERFRVDQPLYLTRGAVRYRTLPSGRWAIAETEASSDYTTDPRKSIDHDQAPQAKRRSAVPVLVGPEELDQFTQRAHQRERARRREHGQQLDGKPLADRVAELERVARQQRADITSDLRLIRHMLANGRTQHALSRVEQLETTFGQRAA